MLPRRFALVRHVDYTGVSGVGVVAYGVAFSDGQVALRWCSAHPATSLWASLDDLLAVHSHGEATSIEWIDAPYGDVEDVSPTRSIGGRAEPEASKAPVPEPEPQASEAPEPEPEGPEAPHSEPEGSEAPEPEPLAPLPRRPLRVVSHSEREAANGRLSTDTSPLLFDPFGQERDRPTSESSQPPPPVAPPAAPAAPPPRRPGRHRRPDPSE